jgi:hypothetical protein
MFQVIWLRWERNMAILQQVCEMPVKHINIFIIFRHLKKFILATGCGDL